MDFFEEVEEALEMGHESINDLAESVVITKMKEGQLSAAKYWLENNKRKYIKPRRKEDLAGRITGNAIVFVDGTMEESEDIAST